MVVLQPGKTVDKKRIKKNLEVPNVQTSIELSMLIAWDSQESFEEELDLYHL